MAKKSKKQRLDVEATAISYTDYNTILSIQLLIDRLNQVATQQRDLMVMVSRIESKLSQEQEISGKDSFEDEEIEESDGDSEQDSPVGAG